MHLLSDPDQTTPVDPGAPPPPYLPDPVAAAGGRTCAHCSAGMVPEQDWCLECGTAAPGRLGGRPGWRVASTVLLLTLALSGGAAAASYAAISSDANQEAASASMGSGAPIAQAGPAIPGPAAVIPPPVVPPAPVGTSGASGSAGAGAPSGPSGNLPEAPKPSVVVPPADDATPTPVVTPPDPVAPVDPPDGDGSTTTDEETTPPPDTSPQPIELAGDAATLYDPDGLRVEAGDPDDPTFAIDGDADTTWFVATDPDASVGPQGMRVGLLLDLGAKREIRSVEYTTATPGHTVEVYGTTRAETPPDIIDGRWDLLAKRTKVDESSRGRNQEGDGEETIPLKTAGADGAPVKYRKIVLWFTRKPSTGSDVGITEVTVSG